jgi:hypothetical protein
MLTFTVVDTETDALIGAFPDEDLALTAANALVQSHGLEHLAVQLDDGYGHATVIAEGQTVVKLARGAQPL